MLIPKPNVHVRVCNYIPIGELIKPNISSLRAKDRGSLMQASSHVMIIIIS